MGTVGVVRGRKCSEGVGVLLERWERSHGLTGTKSIGK